MEEIINYSLADVQVVAQKLLKKLDEKQIMTFIGSLGAGKTTLVRAMLRELGVQGVITSPTFTYVNIYKDRSGRTIYHFDLYRVGSVDEFFAAGFDEYLHNPGSIVLIEWPEVIMPLLANAWHVAIEYGATDQERVMEIK